MVIDLSAGFAEQSFRAPLFATARWNWYPDDGLSLGGVRVTIAAVDVTDDEGR